MLYLSIVVIRDLSLLYFFQTDPLTSSLVPLCPQDPPETSNVLLKFTVLTSWPAQNERQEMISKL